MTTLRVVEIIGWIALPTVMYGGYSLLGLIGRDRLTAFQQTYFRAGHAHAGVIVILSLICASADVAALLSLPGADPSRARTATRRRRRGDRGRAVAVGWLLPAHGDWPAGQGIAGDDGHVGRRTDPRGGNCVAGLWLDRRLIAVSRA